MFGGKHSIYQLLFQFNKKQSYIDAIEPNWEGGELLIWEIYPLP